MTKILLLYYSSWGHMESMALAAAEGAHAAGAEVAIRRVPELVDTATAEAAFYKLKQDAPLAKPNELQNYDGIIFGTPTRFGMMSAQMRNFLDQTGPLWSEGKLIGKVGSVMCATASQHGGQESTILSFHTTLLHHGMVVVGLPYSFAEQNGSDEVKGCSPYGASTISNSDGSRMPSETELAGARFQGEHVAKIASALSARFEAQDS